MLSKDKRIIIFIALLIARIPLSHIIGDNGMGFFAGPMECFWCIYLLFGSGITSTISGMMRERMKREQVRNASLIYSIAKKYVFIAAALLLIIGLVSFDFISTKILLDPGARLACILIGPALMLGLFVDLNIGFLSGTDNIKAAILGELIDAVSILIFVIVGSKIGYMHGIKIANLLLNEDVAAMYGAMGAMIGLCVGELVALIALLVMTIIYQRTFKHLLRTDSSRRTEYTSDITSRLFGGLALDGLQGMILQIPIIILLILFRKHCIANEVSDISAMVGAFYGKYLCIVGIISGLAVIPVNGSIKGILVAANDSDDQLAGERISRLFGRIMYFSIPAAIFVTMLVPSVIATFFTGRVTTVTTVLNIGCAVIVLYPLMYTFVAILVRLGYGKEMIFVSSIGLVISTVLGFILVYKGNMELKGIAVILMINYAFIALFCLAILFRNFRLKLRLLQQFVLPILVAGIIGILIKLLSGVLLAPVGGVLTLCICIVPAWFAYNVACMFLRVVSAGAMERKLFGRILIKFGVNIGIY